MLLNINCFSRRPDLVVRCMYSVVSILRWRFRSLELFFATNQGPWSGEHLNNKSPRLSRKFSSPPPVSIPSRTSSPIHSRKLSLSSPVSSKGGALDLSTASSSAASSPTSPYNPIISSPPHTCTKAPLDLSRGPSSPELSPSTPEEGGELPRIDAFCGKLRRSIRRGERCCASSIVQPQMKSSSSESQCDMITFYLMLRRILNMNNFVFCHTACLSCSSQY